MEQKLANWNYHFPLHPVCFYFTCRNSEEGWYIQNLKIILFFLVRPKKRSFSKFFYLFYSTLFSEDIHHDYFVTGYTSHIRVRSLFHTVLIPNSLASLPPGVMLCMYRSIATNLEIALPILKKCSEKMRQARVN